MAAVTKLRDDKTDTSGTAEPLASATSSADDLDETNSVAYSFRHNEANELPVTEEETAALREFVANAKTPSQKLRDAVARSKRFKFVAK